MKGLSERQYAARVGLSRGAVQKAKAAGRLVVHDDGSIDAERSDAHRAATNPRRSYGRKWVMGSEKAAYRGGCVSLPEPPKGALRH